MDELYNLINNRASCRSFLEKEIPDEVINKILNAACKSPSSGGFQKYSIIKVKKDETKAELAKLCRSQNFIKKAPVNLVFCIDFRRINRINEVIPAPCDEINQFSEFMIAIIDTAICAQTLCLAAEAEGLGSVYIGNIIYTMDQVSKVLKLPQYVLPSIMVTLGYPKNQNKLSEKYDLDVLVHDEEYMDMDIDELMNHYNSKYKNWNMKITDNFINKIYDTCYNLRGKEFADKCKEYIINNGKISSFQYWFGYYYLQHEDFLDFDKYINYMKKQGFNWLK
jgi:FMN reductase [NAD(P)H]